MDIFAAWASSELFRGCVRALLGVVRTYSVLLLTYVCMYVSSPAQPSPGDCFQRRTESREERNSAITTDYLTFLLPYIHLPYYLLYGTRANRSRSKSFHFFR